MNLAKYNKLMEVFEPFKYEVLELRA